MTVVRRVGIGLSGHIGAGTGLRDGWWAAESGVKSRAPYEVVERRVPNHCMAVFTIKSSLIFEV